MAENSVDLPEECWELVFNLIADRHNFASLSLVSKLFFSITNQLITTLRVSHPTVLVLPQLLRRFTRLRTIDLSAFRGDINGLLCRISESGLELEALNISNRMSLPILGLRVLGSKMKKLRSLYCSKIVSLQDRDLGSIANAFPFLEELDISYPEYEHSYFSNGLLDSGNFSKPISDSGILALSMKLKGLRKINLSGNHFITNMSLSFLATNCVLLSEIVMHHCPFVTETGIALMILRCANLSSLSVAGITINDSLVSAKALSCVEFTYSIISDELLYSIAEAYIPLTKLVLSNCGGFTFDGVSFLLSKHQSLQYFDLERAGFLTDKSVFQLTKFLRSTTYINLSMCTELTDSTFFNLIENCPVLNEISMVGTNVGAKDLSTRFLVNTRVKSLNLAQNRSLGNESIKKFASVCPNLKLLDLSRCQGITDEGILEVSKRCPVIKYLGMNQCSGINTFLMDFELSKLEVLCVRGLGINDDEMALIGNRCPQLLKLDLTGCLKVTAEGVKEVVKSCRALREINLKWCSNVNIDIVAWMVFSRPSLKRIVPPCEPREGGGSWIGVKKGCGGGSCCTGSLKTISGDGGVDENGSGSCGFAGIGGGRKILGDCGTGISGGTITPESGSVGVKENGGSGGNNGSVGGENSGTRGGAGVNSCGGKSGVGGGRKKSGACGAGRIGGESTIGTASGGDKYHGSVGDSIIGIGGGRSKGGGGEGTNGGGGEGDGGGGDGTNGGGGGGEGGGGEGITGSGDDGGGDGEGRRGGGEGTTGGGDGISGGGRTGFGGGGRIAIGGGEGTSGGRGEGFRRGDGLGVGENGLSWEGEVGKGHWPQVPNRYWNKGSQSDLVPPLLPPLLLPLPLPLPLLPLLLLLLL
ncbi:Leucine-rich repeat, cysteine-containing subtype [Trema orientale]|uniref:Leucine-rich repeat, cysteine-containing subtype n=1 Tax=Trema orientale TaxID=63057 RepID=A0A2P5E624_TREOI|nr:Leucine-rich repeat, cysteine-containing subtype [Trema orientale]